MKIRPFIMNASRPKPVSIVANATAREIQRRGSPGRRRMRQMRSPASQSRGSESAPGVGGSRIRKTTGRAQTHQLSVAGVPLQVSVPAGVLGPSRQQAVKDQGSARNTKATAAKIRRPRQSRRSSKAAARTPGINFRAKPKPAAAAERHPLSVYAIANSNTNSGPSCPRARLSTAAPPNAHTNAMEQAASQSRPMCFHISQAAASMHDCENRNQAQRAAT